MTLTGFCQNKIISEALQEAWFSHKHAIGAEYPKYFNPVPLVTLALILTVASCILLYPQYNKLMCMIQIEFCIEEWSSGMFVKAEFNEKATLIATKHTLWMLLSGVMRALLLLTIFARSCSIVLSKWQFLFPLFMMLINPHFQL